jgi:hypothetical protein
MDPSALGHNGLLARRKRRPVVPAPRPASATLDAGRPEDGTAPVCAMKITGGLKRARTGCIEFTRVTLIKGPGHTRALSFPAGKLFHVLLARTPSSQPLKPGLYITRQAASGVRCRCISL